MRKRIVGVLLVVVIAVISVGLVGLWWGKQTMYPFVFETPRFRLTENWYLGEFQPIFWKQYQKDNATYFKVVYRGSFGEIKFGDVLVGGSYQGNELANMPYVEEDEVDTAKGEEVGFKYPFQPGQRIKVTFLVSSDVAQTKELDQYCQTSPRVCEVGLVVSRIGKSQNVLEKGGLYPQMPVVGVGVEAEVIENLGAN